MAILSIPRPHTTALAGDAAAPSQTIPYTSLTTVIDPVSGLATVTYCGFSTRLSDIVSAIPAGGAHMVAVFTDSLVVDVAQVKTTGLILMAREIDILGLDDKALMLDFGAGREGVAQFLIGGATGGTFKVASVAQPGTAITPPVGTSPPVAATYLQPAIGGLTPVAGAGARGVQDLVSRSWAMNSLKACYAGAAGLMDEGSPGSRASAQRTFAWIVACTSSMASGDLQMPSDYAELYNQAAALLVTLNVAPGAVFVPVLSGTFYSQQMDRLLAVLRDYEARISTLDTQKDVAAAVAAVSAGLKETAGIEGAPLQVQLDNISANIQSLFNDIRELRGNFMRQSATASTAFAVLGTAISMGNITKKLQVEMDMAMTAISLGFNTLKASTGDLDAAKEGTENSAKQIQNLVKLIDAANAGGAGDGLTAGAKELLASHQAMMETVLNGRMLWEQALANRSGGVLPASLAAITIDPVTSWDNYMAAADAKISILKRQIGDDSNSQNKADLYLSSLKILTGYGKAIDGKFAAYVGQLVQATVVLAQIKAAGDVEARWADAQAKATSDAEKLAALKALIQGRSDAIKRSIYVAWSYYSASFFYLTFSEPPRTLHIDMTAAAFGDALSGVADWVARAIGNASDGKHIQLPSVQATIELDFAVLQPGGFASGAGGADVAVLQQNSDGGWSLDWVLPLGTGQLNGVLPNEGQCAIWISQGAFFLDGVTPNSKGNVIATVATSGTYQNGFGPHAGHTFVTNGMIGNYAYRVSDTSVFSPWTINTAVYMTPTPYTQWTMTLPPGSGDPRTASRLRVILTVNFLTP